MTTAEGIELAEIKKRLRSNHATRADIARGRELLAGEPNLLERFNQLVAGQVVDKRGGDHTAEARKARQRERENAFEISYELTDWELRESCRFDLVRFGIIYCRNLLNHNPSERMIRKLILPLQNQILYGGLYEVEFSRGTGKTTWIKIAMLWAALYGHKRFIMTIAATSAHAKSINEQLLLTLEGSEPLQRDFPAICVPVMAIAGNWRKASTQKFEGRPTRIANSEGYIVLPSIYKAGTDEPMEVACGAVFYTSGIHGSIRGVSIEKLRPDFIIFDDPQTREEAESPASSDKLERLIEGDAMGNFGHSDIRSAVMAITPIRPGDIASRFSNRRLHPTWGSTKQPYIIEKSERYDELFPLYRAAYADDVAAQQAANDRGEPLTGDSAWRLSTEFYLTNREAFAGTEVVDPLNFNQYETDAIHHILNVQASYRDLSLFDAEMQMDVTSEAGGEALDPDEVAGKLNGFPRDVLPPGVFSPVAFIDVNTAKGAGLRWMICGFGPNRVAAILDYGSYPENGAALVPPNTAPAAKKDLIKRGIMAVVKKIVTVPLRHPNGTRVLPTACAVDAGYASDAVHEAVTTIAETVALHGMDLYASIGRGWSQFMNFRQSEERAIVERDHVYSGVVVKKANGQAFTRKYLGMQSDYWREIAQKSLWGTPLESGTVSFFGKDESIHREAANEICYEKLVRTYREDKKPFRMAWEWANDNPGHNHTMDCLYGCFAVAAWKGLYQAMAARPSLTAKRVTPIAKEEWLSPGEVQQVASRPAVAVRPKRSASRFKTRFVKG